MSFFREMTAEQADLLSLWPETSPAIFTVEDNMGKAFGVPVSFTLSADDDEAYASLTLDELTQLRNILNEAIVWAEGVMAG